jgi:hypothetical protein
LITRADVQSAFDEISEQYHVAGIELRFDQQNGGPLQAIFEPIDRRNTSRCGNSDFGPNRDFRPQKAGRRSVGARAFPAARRPR